MKTSLKVAAVLVFAGTLFLNVSFDSKGHCTLVSKAHAFTVKVQRMAATCPDLKTTIYVCGQGSNDSCTPSGICPQQ